MPSNTKLTDLVADMQDLVAIDAGEISACELAHRAVVIGIPPDCMVVPQGYTRPGYYIDPDTADAAWEEFLDSEEHLAWYRSYMDECAYKYDLPSVPPPKDIPEPDPERFNVEQSDSDHSADKLPDGSSHKIGIVRKVIRKAIRG